MSKKTKTILIISSVLILTAVIVFGCFKIFNKTKTYEVTFEDGFGKKIETQIVEEGEKVNKPKDPTNEEYIFVEWTYQNKTYDFSLEVTSNLTLKAKWEKTEKDVEKFTVKFDSDEGTTISNQIIEKGKKVEKPNNPTRKGYIFKGWFLEDEEYDFEKEITKNITLVAKWEKEKTNIQTNNNITNNNEQSNTKEKETSKEKYWIITVLTYNSRQEYKVKDGEKMQKPNYIPTDGPEGTEFKYWYINEYDKEFDFNTPITKNYEISAIYGPPSIKGENQQEIKLEAPQNVFIKSDLIAQKNCESGHCTALLTFDKVENADCYEVFYSEKKDGEYKKYDGCALESGRMINLSTTDKYYKVRASNSYYDEKIEGPFSDIVYIPGYIASNKIEVKAACNQYMAYGENYISKYESIITITNAENIGYEIYHYKQNWATNPTTTTTKLYGYYKGTQNIYMSPEGALCLKSNSTIQEEYIIVPTYKGENYTIHSNSVTINWSNIEKKTHFYDN